MKQIIAWIVSLFSGKKKPVIIVPPVIIPPPNIEQPYKLNWPDRRPICAMFLSSYSDNHKTERNWKIEGVEEFESTTAIQAAILKHADNSVIALKDMNAQGMVLWDGEGQQYGHPISYIGDPSLIPTLAPEFDAVADSFFKKFTDAGLKVGVCIRPDILKDKWHYAAPDPASELIRKISYAKARWGCTMFYVDSNVWPDPIYGQVMSAKVFEAVAKAHPDCLIMPEHENNEYYQFTAPYQQLVSFRHLLNPDEKGFMVLYVPDAFPGWSDESVVTRLKESIGQGNIIMYRNWHEEPLNKLIKQAYDNK